MTPSVRQFGGRHVRWALALLLLGVGLWAGQSEAGERTKTMTLSFKCALASAGTACLGDYPIAGGNWEGDLQAIALIEGDSAFVTIDSGAVREICFYGYAADDTKENGTGRCPAVVRGYAASWSAGTWLLRDVIVATLTVGGTTTLAPGLTGVLRADTGVVSVDGDVTDIVGAATTTAAGKVELATDAETVTGTDTVRATTPANLTARLAAPGAIGGTTPAAGTFTTLGAGAGGFSVDADGDVTAKSVTVAKSSGVAGDIAVYEANSTDTHGAGFRGPASITGDGAYRLLFPNARAAAANSALVVTNSGESGSGTAADPYIQTGSWLALPANPMGGTLGATTNVIPKSSGTGTATLQASGITEDGTKVDLGALNLVTTGTVTGAIKVTTDSNGMTSGEMTTAGMYGTFYVASGAGTWALPAAATGMSFCIYSTTAAAVVVNPDNADIITLNGTALAAGDSITSASAAGDFICLLAVSDSSWLTLGRSGTWTDTN